MRSQGDLLRIAILFEYPTLNGGERSMLATLGLVNGNEIDAVALAPRAGRLANALAAHGIDHLPFQVFDERRKRRPRERVIGELTDAVRFLNPGLLHANSLSMGVLTGAIEMLPRSAHLRDMISLSATAIGLLNQNDALLAVSAATREMHVSQGLDDAKARIVRNGVDCEQFAPRARVGFLRTDVGIDRDAIVALCVGQIGLRKGLDVLLEAAAAVFEQLPQLHLVLVGERNSSKQESIDYESRLRGIAAAPPLRGRVHWLGYREDMPALMNEADFLVHAAHQEPYGRVLLEASAAGLPILATEVGGTPEIVLDEQTGRLVGRGDIDGLSKGLRELTTGQRVREAFGRAARERAVTRFSHREAAAALVEAWQETHDRRSKL